jgi:O-antigen/teichoic acid export membrane protein
VAAIGSSALRNSVAVTTAEALHRGTSKSSDASGRRRRDGSIIEALILGGVGTLGVILFAPTISAPGAVGVAVVGLTASAMIPNFLFARAQGRLQGEGDSRSVVWWSSGAQVAQALLALVAVLLGGDAVAILAILVLTAVAGALGASIQSRRDHLPAPTRAFTANSTVVLLLTVGFAWMTNADVVFVRGLVHGEAVGAYAAAAVLIKTTLIVPATFSLYLLPRFVRRRDDTAMTALGVNVILAATIVTGLLMFGVVSLFGDFIVHLLFGAGYAQTEQIVIPFSLAWIPWALAQGVLVRITAAASRAALIAFGVAIAAQFGLAILTLPSIVNWLLANGILGLLLFAVLFAIHLRLLRSTRNAAASGLADQRTTSSDPGVA